MVLSYRIFNSLQLLLLQLLPYVFCSRNITMMDLHHDLFRNYVPGVRPVIDPMTTTNVTYRVAFRSLLSLDTREQTLTVGCFLKATWRDEFLTWNPEDYNGITLLTTPVSSIWTPDITLNDNADIGFERTKPNTRAQIYSDGTVIWFAPVIYTSSCHIRVQWFPFDSQVCDVIFLSWAYDGFKINLEPEKSADADQDWYVNNGVWDMVAVRAKRVVHTYLCCPEPYYQLHYRLVFTRHAAFYIYYMVLPCLFLSILSLLVFYLPPDCGEKLTLSITNLLALVVFQQIIAENMPPSSDDSPVIGTYFICMIAMVCFSVISTGFVMHVSGISQPLPTWVRRLFLEIIPRFLCLSVNPFDAKVVDVTEASSHVPSFKDVYQNENGVLTNGHVDIVGKSVAPVRNGNSNSEFAGLLKFMKEDIKDKNLDSIEHLQWRRVSVIIDRMLLYIFSLFTIVCTAYLSVRVVLGSAAEYDDIMKNLDDNWPL